MHSLIKNVNHEKTYLDGSNKYQGFQILFVQLKYIKIYENDNVLELIC